MISLEEYKDYYRLFPKLRLSQSVKGMIQKAEKSGNWDEVWDYFTGKAGITTEAMREGKRRHEAKEILGVDDEHFDCAVGRPLLEYKDVYEFKKIPAVIVVIADVLWEPYIGDYKSGNFYKSNEEQLELYWDVLTEKGFNITMGKLLHLQKDLTIGHTRTFIFDKSKKGQRIAEMEQIGVQVLDKIMSGDLDRYLILNS